MPRVGDVPAETVSSHIKCGIQIARRDDVEDVMVVDVHNVFPFDRARVLVIERALQVECEYQLFIDADVILPLDTFDLLYEALIDKAAVAVSGNYHRRGHPYTSVWSKIIESDNKSDKSEEPVILAVHATTGVHQIHTSGLGCCLINLLWVRDNLEKPYFKMGYKEDGTNIWEDSYFFTRIYEKGGLVYGHADVKCSHLTRRGTVTEDNWRELVQASTVEKVSLLEDDKNASKNA